MATVTPPYGWTDKKARLHLNFYWTDAPGSNGAKFLDAYGISGIMPLWTPYPDQGEVMFIFRGINRNNQLRYYLWEGLTDNVFGFEEVSLENIKKKIDSEYGSLKKLQPKNMDSEIVVSELKDIHPCIIHLLRVQWRTIACTS